MFRSRILIGAELSPKAAERPNYQVLDWVSAKLCKSHAVHCPVRYKNDIQCYNIVSSCCNSHTWGHHSCQFFSL